MSTTNPKADGAVGYDTGTTPQRKVAPNQRELTGAYDHSPAKEQ